MSSEADAIAASSGPVTAGSLLADLRALGVHEGDVLLVHASMSKLGWVAGGPQAVVEALLSAVGATGTLVTPAQSGQLSDPAHWSNPPVPAQWHQLIRESFPAYDPYLTPTRGMGQVVECFRQHRATLRSAHPTLSFAANGPHAASILEPHALTPGLGEGSPLSRLYDMGAQVLLLGVDHTNSTALHLAEYRASWPGKQWGTDGGPVRFGDETRWVSYEDLELETEDFASVGEAFAGTGAERSGRVGLSTGRLSHLPDLVDFATDWIARHRP